MKTLSIKDLSISPRLISETAVKMGFTVNIIDSQTAQLLFGDSSWYVCGSRTSLQSSVGYTMALRKHQAKLILKKNLLPTANYVVINNENDLGELKKLSLPIVIKPSEGSQSRSIFADVKTIPEAEAIVLDLIPGLGLEEWVLCEEHLEGNEYRIVCIDNNFVGAFYRKAAHVIGNGKNTIKELVEEKNSHPWRGSSAQGSHSSPLSTIKIDKHSHELLDSMGYSINDVPPKGIEVPLKQIASLSIGGEAENISDQVCKENIEIFEKVSKVLDLNIAGIDVMCHDLSSPISDQKSAGIIEVNGSPGIRMCHYPLVGEPINIAKMIVEQLLASI